MMRLFSFLLLGVLFLGGCVPKKEVEFRGIRNINVDMGPSGNPLLRADVQFFNPNDVSMTLKEVDMIIHVNGAHSATVKQNMNLSIPRQSDFTVPIEAKLELQTNLLDAVVGMLGGKKYEVEFKGHIRVRVHGVTVRVPVAQKQELKLSL